MVFVVLLLFLPQRYVLHYTITVIAAATTGFPPTLGKSVLDGLRKNTLAEGKGGSSIEGNVRTMYFFFKPSVIVEKKPRPY